MEHQQEIGLRPAQVDAIKQAMHEAQQQLVDLQWRLDAESGRSASRRDRPADAAVRGERGAGQVPPHSLVNRNWWRPSAARRTSVPAGIFLPPACSRLVPGVPCFFAEPFDLRIVLRHKTWHPSLRTETLSH